MVFSMMNQKKYGIRPEINNLIIEESGDDNYVNLEDPEYKKTQLENFINQEKIKQQNELYESINKNINNIQSDISNSLTSDYVDSKRLNNNIKISTKETNTNNIVSNTSVNESTTLLSRASFKNKEIDNIIGSSGITNTNQTNSNEANTNETNETNEASTKTSIVEILTSPPAIRQKKEDRLNDLIELGKKVANKQKKNIKITRSNNNIMSEKFDTVESFYQDMINSR
jgi:predicted transport protein